jgi:hypothetical protein
MFGAGGRRSLATPSLALPHHNRAAVREDDAAVSPASVVGEIHPVKPCERSITGGGAVPTHPARGQARGALPS